MTKLLRCLTLVLCLLLVSTRGAAQVAPLIANINARQATSLNGQWQAIVDPYEVGALDYRAQPLKNNQGFYKNVLLDSAAFLEITLLGGFDPLGQAFDIMNYTSLVG